jgi:hypothetical protein
MSKKDANCKSPKTSELADKVEALLKRRSGKASVKPSAIEDSTSLPDQDVDLELFDPKRGEERRRKAVAALKGTKALEDERARIEAEAAAAAKAMKAAELTWQEAAWERCAGKCSGCGSGSSLSIQLVVPAEQGGQKIAENATVLCRSCLWNKRIQQQEPTRSKRVFTPWIPQEIYAWAIRFRAARGLGGLLRELLRSFYEHPELFKDLPGFLPAPEDGGSELGLDEGGGLARGMRDHRVRFVMWLSIDEHEAYRAACINSGLTMNNATVALLNAFRASKKGEKD